MSEVCITFLVLLAVYAPYAVGKYLIASDEAKQKEARKQAETAASAGYDPAVIDGDDLLDNSEEYADLYDSFPPSEREQREEFYRQQAALDSEFLIDYLDDLYEDYNHVQEEIEYLNNRIEICEAAHKYETANKCRKEIEKLSKRRRTLSGQIHGTEKKLRTAQFKSGQKVSC